MKQALSLLDVCKLPDVQLHSKQALLKALVNKEEAEALNMREQIVKLSYTIKTIGVQAGQVGISSKRVPLKLKKTEEYHKQQFVPTHEFLPHRSFYAEALVPIRKNKEKNEVITGDPALQISSARGNSIHIELDPYYESQQLKTRTKSMAQLRSSKSLKKAQMTNQEFGRVQGRPRGSSVIQKQSFSTLLRECSLKQNTDEINPLLHKENPLFKKIKRIKLVYPNLCKQERTVSQFQRPITKHSSISSNLLKYYRERL